MTSDELLAWLRLQNIDAPTTEHPAVFTVEQSQKLRGDIAGAHTKNLFLRDDKKNYFLVVFRESREVNLKDLRKVIGARGGLSFASQDALREILQIEAGSVSPLAVINDTEHRVKVAIESQLLSKDVINCHPLINTRTTSLTPEQLRQFLSATGHDPVVLELA